MAPRFATTAIVLRTVAYGESDLVVTLLGPTTGRLSALARGARKSARRFGGGLGMGAEGQAALRERPGADLLLLEEFEVAEARLGLAGDLGKTAHAAYALEMCDRLCPARHAEPAAFDWLREFLLRLETGRASAERLRVLAQPSTVVRFVIAVILVRRIRVGTPIKAACSVHPAPIGATS